MIFFIGTILYTAKNGDIKCVTVSYHANTLDEAKGKAIADTQNKYPFSQGYTISFIEMYPLSCETIKTAAKNYGITQ